ncbi:hypothetical protein J1N35_035502 [Gossypium stocksii]|uniref:Zinc knuckle CX2CX4HX4C domain-containing protein n=1 Tax=Gossypium stocksii TaxID=47602 RepID=A0A9D3UU41_9ROSI|nr:hypothetical protein J1N35_035502 [Gossypium stocksii]
METYFAELSLNEEEEEILPLQFESQPGREVGIHDIPSGFVTERLAIQLGNFIGTFMEYDGSNLEKAKRNFMRIRVQIDIRYPLKRKKQIMFFSKCSYVHFKYEQLSLFCFYYGRLGHSDSFCEAKMALGVEVAEMG